MSASYVIQFASGELREGLDESAVRRLIESGEMTSDDRLSRDGSPPQEFYLYDEFVDLWDADDFGFGFGGDTPSPPKAVQALAPPPGPAPAAPSAPTFRSDAPVSETEALIDDVLDDVFGPSGDTGAQPLVPQESVEAPSLSARPAVTPPPTPAPPPSRRGTLSAEVEAAVPDPMSPRVSNAVASAPPAVDHAADTAPLPDLAAEIESELASLADGPIIDEREHTGSSSIISSSAIEPLGEEALEANEDPAIFEISESQELPALDLSDAKADPDFHGYDALSDELLDPLTIRELLYDSSLYTALAVAHTADEEALNQSYLNRAELIAARQRSMGRTELDQIAALEDIRRLVFQAFEHLREESTRSAYDAVGAQAGAFANARDVLDIAPLDPTSQDFRGSGTFSMARGMTGRSRAPRELVSAARRLATDSGTKIPRIQSSPKAFAPEGHLSLQNPSEDGGKRPYTSPLAAVDGGPTLITGTHSAVDIPRVYTAPHKAVETGQLSAIGPAREDLFAENVPSLARDEIAEAKRLRRARAAKTGEVEFTIDETPAAGVDALPLTWGGLANTSRAGAGFVQSLVTIILIVGASLYVVMMTDLGAEELNYGGPSPWFYGRVGLLLAMTLLGTVALRRESILRIGLKPSVGGIFIGLGVGAILGVLAALVAPIRVDESVPFEFVAGLLFLQVFSQELFFRGFVTRVLLVEIKKPLYALTISSILYGLFWLSYDVVLGQEGFYVFYYSVLLYGCGLGGILGYLFFRTKSLWTTIVTYYMVLLLAFVFGGG